jgi:hypothetical protein
MKISVVGGTYREESLDPVVRRLGGSGVRAARILSALGVHITLHTCVDAEAVDELQMLASTYSIALAVADRDGALGYLYPTPVQSALREGEAIGRPLHIDGDVVVGFGMVESTWTVSADRAVIDPQHSSVADILTRVTAPHVAVVLNEHEARRFTGRSGLSEAASELLAPGVEVVVIKRGAHGGLVATAAGNEVYGVVPTPTVDPIGSGDAFTAGFAHAWAVESASPLEAATYASRVAAAHSLAGMAAFSQDVLATIATPTVFRADVEPIVYLAAPFFSVAERAQVRVVEDAVQHLGVRLFSPLRDIGVGGDEVALKDLDALSSCASLLAILDGGDIGTAFEVGWATHAGIPVVALAETPNDHAWTMIRGTGGQVTSDLSSAVYGAAWAALRYAAEPS